MSWGGAPQWLLLGMSGSGHSEFPTFPVTSSALSVLAVRLQLSQFPGALHGLDCQAAHYSKSSRTPWALPHAHPQTQSASRPLLYYMPHAYISPLPTAPALPGYSPVRPRLPQPPRYASSLYSSSLLNASSTSSRSGFRMKSNALLGAGGGGATRAPAAPAPSLRRARR